MKKIIFIMLLGLVCNTINAQIVTKQELEEYTNIGDMSWSAKAKELSNEYKLNELGELSLSIIKEYKGQSKSQLYRKIIDWVISMSSDAKSAIQVSNEEEGTIMARCYLPNIAKRTMGDNSYRVSIRPLIQGERSITCTSYYSLYFFNPNDFISYFLVPSTRFPLSCHSQFDIALF